MSNAEDSFHASPDSIRKLQLILSKVAENDGKMVPGEMWSDEDLEQYAHSRSLANHVLTFIPSKLVINATGNKDAIISLANSILKREEDLLQSISFLYSSLTTRISIFCAQKPKRSVTDLPNEIILSIIELSEPGIDDLRHLLLVSERFRQLVLSSPCLWARQALDPSLSPYTIDVIARRSGVLGLQAYFKWIPDAGHAIFRYCDRWTSLLLYRLSEDDVTRFQSYVPCTKLACLEKIAMNLELSESWDNIWLLNDSTCSLSSLKTIIYHSGTSMLLLPQSPALSYCCLNFWHFLPIGKPATFLSACPSLEHLEITLQSIEDDDTIDNNVLLETSLPTLKTFALIALNAKNPVVEGLFRSISFPGVTTFRVFCYSGQILTVRWFWENLWEMRSRYPVLKKAQFHISCKDGEIDDHIYDIQDIFARLPDSLQDLKLSFEDIYLRADDRGIEPDDVLRLCEKILTIEFSYCNRLDPKFFDGLATILNKYGIKLDGVGSRNCTESAPNYRELGDSEFDDDESNDSGFEDEEPSYDESGDEEFIH